MRDVETFFGPALKFFVLDSDTVASAAWRSSEQGGNFQRVVFMVS
jgi:hypothetical protein